MNDLKYITYQTFPSKKANTIQTIDNLKYLKKYFNVELIFPLREAFSSSNIEDLKEFYGDISGIKFTGTDHKLPFGKISYFEKYLFLFSHFLWSKRNVKTFIEPEDYKKFFFTRSEWVFYFLSKKNLDVIFECHQFSKLRKWILDKSIKYPNSKILFLNENLLRDSNIPTEHSGKLMVLHNGVDEKLFRKKVEKNENEIVFAGNLKRFDEDRNLKFIIDSLKNFKLSENFTLKIVGADKEEGEELERYIKKLNLNSIVKVVDRQNRENTIRIIESAEIGLLINSSENEHSFKYTSPLKYFEYLYSQLKILAIDFPAHRQLPFANNIQMFEEGDIEGFQASLKNCISLNPISIDGLDIITLEHRAKKIYNFFNVARLEGFEPPTL
tara:strand:- start:888 stop:2039 length:1152 start_codon:yes stop_codon:yes gene_type:complete